MHTARMLKQEMFNIEVGGNPTSRNELFEHWGPLDRFGIVIHEPFGAIGASYLTQLAITAFYDARESRRDRERPVYPDVFAFHVGGRYGDLAHFDFFPARKEIFVENEPSAILEAINDRGITHLAVPDRDRDRVQLPFKEPAQAIDRLTTAWAYSADGAVVDGDVTISSSAPGAEANTKMTLHPSQSYMERQSMMEAIGSITVPDDELMVFPEPRDDEVSGEVRDQILAGRERLRSDAGWTERYRRLSPEDSLRMLHRGAAPAFATSGRSDPRREWERSRA